MRKVFLTFIFLILLVAQLQAAKQAIDFTLTDFNGNNVSLSDFKGKPILLDFWASWCRPCRIAMPFIGSLYDKYSKDGFVVIGINLDRRVDIPKFKRLLESLNVHYTNVVGQKGEVMRKYGVVAMPTTVLIDPDFNQAMRFVGLNRSSERKLEDAIKGYLYGGGEPIGVCLGFIKVVGDGAGANLGDKIRRLIYKKLGAADSTYNIEFSVPGEQPKSDCDYKLNGLLTANAGKGRLTVKIIDAEKDIEIKSLSTFGKLSDTDALVEEIVSKLKPELKAK